MNSLSNLSRKNLKINKSKNILIVIAIVLSTCLITTIGILCYSLQQMKVKDVISQTGDFHVEYENIDEKQADMIKNNKKLNMASEYIALGFNEEYSPYSIEMCYLDKNAGTITQYYKLKEGQWPQKEKDIAMPKWMLEKMGVKPQIGEKVTLSYSEENRKWHYEGKDEFTVSGILDEGEFLKNVGNKAMAVVSKDYVLKNVKPEYRNIHVDAKIKGRNISDTAYEIGESIGVKNKDKDITLNKEYINALGMSKEAIIPTAIGALVVIFATILVIYNIFYISIKERITQFGMLAALGATKKQIRSVIFKEGLILSIIGIPIGLIIGYLLSCVIVPLLPFDIRLTVEPSPYIFILAAFISLFTVIISLRKPGKIASKISPVEAIRYTTAETGSKKKERKTKGEFRLGRLAYLNLWRSKKRTITTIISMALTGILFILFFSLFTEMKSGKDDHVSSDFELTSKNVQYKDDGSNPITKDILNDVKSIKGIKSVNVFKYKNVVTKDEKVLKKFNTEFLGEQYDDVNELECDVFGFENAMLDELKPNVIQGEISKENLKNKNEVIMVQWYKIGQSKESPCKVGDKIVLGGKEFTVAAIVSKNTRTLEHSAMGPDFIAHEATYSREFNDNRIGRICVDVNKEAYNIVKTSLESIPESNENIFFFDKKEYKQKEEMEYRGIQIAGISLVVIIGLIGMLNSINTMMTSIMSRKKEFGMMQAVGLSDKQLKKLLQMEGLYYSGISVVISVVTGSLASYAIHTQSQFASLRFKPPLTAILLVIVAFIFIEAVITYSAGRKLKKESIVDRMRCE